MTIRRAMILAAGLGTRMAPLTATRPKPLVELRGRALIDHCIDRLAAGGVNFFVVNVHYMAEMLIDHLQKRQRSDKSIEIRICDETEAILDTGGAVAKALPFFEGEPFFTQNSDSLWVEGMGSTMARMNARWNPEVMDALMLLASSVTAVGYDGTGDFEMDSLGLLKRRTELKLAPFVFTGLQILHPRLLDGAPGGKFAIGPYWNRAIEKGRLHGIRLDGVWLHVGTPDGLKDAENFLADLARGP